MADIQVITFDLDNTLWDVEDVIVRAEAHMREWLDAHVPDYFQAFDREALIHLRNSVIAELPHLSHDVSGLRREVLYRGIRSRGYMEREARSLAEGAFARFYEARQQVVLFDGTIDALDQLASDYRLGALTNGNANIATIGLDRFFSFAFCAADVGASKPAPDLFLAALRHARAAPAEGIHIGDHLIDDIQGAGNVGMHSIWVNHKGRQLESQHCRPTREVLRLQDLVGAVQAIKTGEG